MPDGPGFPLGRICRTAILDAVGLRNILWAAASVTALSHHTDSIEVSPGMVLKVAEIYEQSLSLCLPIAAYRQLRYGTNDTGSFDMMEIQTNLAAMRRTRASFYNDLCNNAFNCMARGPGALKQYIEHVVMRMEGQRTALEQYFAAVRTQNDAVRDAIDRVRRRTYAVKVSCEVAMVVLGAFEIPLALQAGTAAGYSLVTYAITSWSDMSKADIIAMPTTQTNDTASDVVVGNAVGTGLNLAQSGGDMLVEEIATFERARQKALGMNQAAVQSKIEAVVAKSGAGRERISKAALNTVKDLTAESEAIAARRATPLLASKGAALGIQGATRAAGIGVGLYFLREDIGNLISFVSNGDL